MYEPPTEAPNEPKTGLSSQLGGSGKGLALALIIAGGFLLASIGLASWLYWQGSGSNKTAVDSSKKITNVSWVVPQAMPEGFVRTDKNTDQTQTIYYSNAGSGCSIVARILPTSSNNDESVAQANDSEGIVTIEISDGSPVKLTDEEGKNEYTFRGIKSQQTVSAPGVSFTKQSSTLNYKQFGDQVAAVSFTCKLDTFDAKAAELTSVLEKFKLKTEGS